MTADGPAHADAGDPRAHLVASAVHELRTPLATVQGCLETLLARPDELGPDEERRVLEIARRNAVLLGHRIDTLLEHERFTTGHVRLVPRPTRLAAAITEVVENCRGLLGDHPVDLRVDADVVVLADTRALAHVLENLLGNAAKHSPAGSRVTVRAAAVPASEPESVEVAVVDRGAGIDPADLDHVLEPFFRGDEHTRGLGLGLAVVHRHVTLWGGRLAIDSEPGRGTTVRFTLPTAHPDRRRVVDVRPDAALTQDPRA